MKKKKTKSYFSKKNFFTLGKQFSLLYALEPNIREPHLDQSLIWHKIRKRSWQTFLFHEILCQGLKDGFMSRKSYDYVNFGRSERVRFYINREKHILPLSKWISPCMIPVFKGEPTSHENFKNQTCFYSRHAIKNLAKDKVERKADNARGHFFFLLF